MRKLKNVLTIIVLLLLIGLVIGLFVAWREGKFDNLLPNNSSQEQEEIITVTSENFVLSLDSEVVSSGSKFSICSSENVSFVTNTNDYKVSVHLDIKTPLCYGVDDVLYELDPSEDISEGFVIEKGSKSFTFLHEGLFGILSRLHPDTTIVVSDGYLDSTYTFIVILKNLGDEELTRFSFDIEISSVSGIELDFDVIEF